MRCSLVGLLLVLVVTTHALASDCQSDGDDDDFGLCVVADGRIENGQFFTGANDGVRVWGPHAHLRMTGGQIVGGNPANSRDADGLAIDLGGAATITGGTISATDDGIVLEGQSYVRVAGGTVHGDDDGIAVKDQSIVVIEGGSIGGDVFALHAVDRAAMTVANGHIAGQVRLFDSSSLRVLGGAVGPVIARDWSSVKIMGGSFQGLIEADDDSTLVIFLDAATGGLLDGSPLPERVNVPRDTDARLFYVDTVQSSLTLENGSNRRIGVLNHVSGQATHVDIVNGVYPLLYLADDSTASIADGRLNGVVVDDQSAFSVRGGQLSDDGSEEAILGLGTASIQIDAGVIQSRRDALRLRSTSRATIAGGTVRSTSRDGVDTAAYSALRVEGGTITGQDDGIRAKEHSSVTLVQGTVIGNDAGVSLSESTSLEMSGGLIEGRRFGISAIGAVSLHLAGGEVHGDIVIQDDSVLRLEGATIKSDVVITDDALVMVSRGSIEDDLRAANSSRVTMNGGSILGGIELRDGSSLIVTNGSIKNGIDVQDESTVRIQGGSVQGVIRTMDSSRVDVFGGILDGEVIAVGGDIYVHGSNLRFDGSRLSGYLDDLTPLNVRVSLMGDGILQLMSNPQLFCDFSSDGRCSAEDLDLLGSLGRLDQGFPALGYEMFDLTGDGLIDTADRDRWTEVAATLHGTGMYVPGDADLDGHFSSSDLVLVFTRGEFEDAIQSNSTWSDGDWNGDQEFSTQDLVLAFQRGSYEPLAVMPVPEPVMYPLAMLVLLACIRRLRSVK